MKRQKECMQTPAPRMHPASINSIFNYISINIYATAGPTSRLNQPSSIKPFSQCIHFSLEVGLARSLYAYIH